MTVFSADGKPLLRDPKLFLFDKDGTLIDVHHYWASMVRIRADFIVRAWGREAGDSTDLAETMIRCMGVGDDGRMMPEGPVGVKPRPFIVRLVADELSQRGQHRTPEVVERLFQEVDAHTAREMAPLLRVLPGVEDFLQLIRETSSLSAIVTTDKTDRAEKAMETLGLTKYFDLIIGGDAVTHAKPSPDLALKAMEVLDRSKAKTIVVGDHPVDIHMGVGAGVAQNIGVLTGLSDRTAFSGLSCQVVESFKSLKLV